MAWFEFKHGFGFGLGLDTGFVLSSGSGVGSIIGFEFGIDAQHTTPHQPTPPTRQPAATPRLALHRKALARCRRAAAAPLQRCAAPPSRLALFMKLIIYFL
jgi:hypothetical protein